MSTEVQQPVQDTPAPTTEPVVAEDAPVAAEGITDGTTAAVPTGPNVTNVPKEENVGKDQVKVESHAINEGVLGHKGPGLKGLLFSKKYFWFSEQPLQHSNLSTYINGEKNKDIAHPNAAHATQTGKGLLFFAKRAEDKDHPQGIINLAHISDLAKGNILDFSFSLHGTKHTFQSPNRSERDGWIVALETRAAEAKSHLESLVETDGYKSNLEKFGKPAMVAAAGKTATAKKDKSKSRERVKEVVNKATGKDSSKDPAKETPKDAPKATEEIVAPAETTATTTEAPVIGTTAAPVATEGVATESAAPKTTETPVEPTAVSTEKTSDVVTDKPTEDSHKGEEATAGAVAGAAAVGGIAATRKDSSDEDKAKSKKSRSQSRGNKRSSIFGSLLGKKDDSEDKKAAKKEEKEEKKAVKKEEKEDKKEVKSAEAAIKKESNEDEKDIEKYEKKLEKEEKKLEKEKKAAEKESKNEHNAADKKAEHEKKAGDAATAVAAAETALNESKAEKADKVDKLDTTALAASGAATETTPTSTNKEKPSKRGSVFGGLFKKDSNKTPAEGTATATTKDEPSTVSSTAPQLDDPVASSTAPVAAEKATEKGADGPAEETTSSAADPTAVAAAVAATKPVEGTIATKSATTPTEKRRTSFFGGIGSKKEKKSGAVSGDELTDGEGKKSGGFGNLLRKASRATPKDKPSTANAPAVPTTKPAEPTEVPLPNESAPEPEIATNGAKTAGEKATETAPVAETTTIDQPQEATKTVEATA